jgi:CRP-like cAMP-binding protein
VENETLTPLEFGISHVLSPLQNLDLAVLLRNAGFRKIVDYKRKDVIFSQGETGNWLFYIEKGSVKLSITSDLGKEAVIAVVDGGNFLGEACISTNLPIRMHSAVALTNLRAMKIARTSMLDMLRKDTQLCFAFSVYLAERFEHVSQDLASSLVQPSEKRLARALLALSDLSPRSDLRLLSVVSQQTLADMIGSTRQRVNLLLKRFKDAGFIEGPEGQKMRVTFGDRFPQD